MLRLLLAFWLMLRQVTADDTQAGLRVMVTEDALREINNAEIRDLRADLDGKNFRDIADSKGNLDYRLSNIRITNLGTISADLDLRGETNSIYWNGYISSVSVEADWRVKYETGGWIRIKISKSGSVDLDVGRTLVGISVTPSVSNGNLQIRLGSCIANIGHLDADFSGGILARILNILTDVFKKAMKSKLEKEICDALKSSLDKVSENMREIETTLETEIIGTRVTIDNSFINIMVTDHNIASYHKGTLTWNGHTYGSATISEPFPAAESYDLSFDIKTGIVSEFVKAISAAGALDGSLTYFSADEKSRTYFLLSCDPTDICIGNLIREVSKLYPERVIGLYWNILDTSIQTRNNDITAQVIGRLKVNADSGTDSDNLFASQFNVTIPAQVKLSGARIAGKVTGIEGSLTIDESSIGKVLTPENKALLKLLQRSMKSTILNKMNAMSTSYAVKLPKEVSIQKSTVAIYPDFLRVALDVCYKRSCHFQGPEVWVGNSTLADDIILELNGIVSTTTTTTLTTPSTTSTSKSSNQNGKAGSQISLAIRLNSSTILIYSLFLISCLNFVYSIYT